MDYRDRTTYVLRDADAYLRDASAYLRRLAEQREAEEAGRQEWIAGVKRRLGIVTIGEQMRPYSLAQPEIPLGWPRDC